MLSSAATLMILLVLAATAVGGRRSTDAAALFVVHQRRHLHRHRHRYDVGKLQLSGGAISEALQGAIRGLDKRQQSKERLLERRRQRRREQQQFDDDNDRINNSNDGRAGGVGVHFVSPLLDDGYPPAVREYYEENEYYSASSSSTSTTSRRKQQQQQQRRRRRPRKKKPLLLYLPGFDGTIIAPFIQYPALNEEFHIFAMTIDMSCNRSTFDELIYYIVNYLLTERKQQSNNDDDGDDDDDNNNNKSRQQREVYLMGESFGALLAIEVALELQRPSYMNYGIQLCGLILVNPATSYLRSNLYRIASTIIAKRNNNNSNRLFIDDIRYTIALFTRLIPLFVDKGQSLRQLYTILSSHGLPSVINTPAREAYMGRVAFTLFDRIAFMPIETLRWRLEEWLEWGASIFEDRLDMLTSVRLSTTTATAASSTTTTTATNDNNNNNNDTTAAPSKITNDRTVIDNYSLLKISQELRTLIIVGEYDNTLPSVEEAARLSNELFRSSAIHVVPNAGHASTCGGSLNLMKVLREVFPELNTDNYYNVDDETRRRRRQQSSSSRIGDENDALTKELYGLVPRYDNAWMGLNPLLYWSKEYYRKCDGRN